MADAAETGRSDSAAGIIADAETAAGEQGTVAPEGTGGSESAPESQGSGDPGGEPQEGHTADELAELEKFFSDGEGSSSDDKGSQGEEKQGGSRVEKRIRSLAARNRAQRQQMQQMHSAHQQQMQAMEQRFHQQQMQVLQQLQQFAPQQPKSDDPVHEFRTELLSEAQKQAQGAYGPEIQRMRQELEQFKQDRAERDSMAQRRQKAHNLNIAVDAAVDQVILPSMGGQADKAVKDRLARMVLMVGHSERLPPAEAAKIVRSTLNGYARSSLRHGYQARGDKLRASQQTPEPTPRGRSGATGESYPEWNLIKKAGYRSYHQWEMDGRPDVS